MIYDKKGRVCQSTGSAVAVPTIFFVSFQIFWYERSGGRFFDYILADPVERRICLVDCGCSD